MRLIIPSISTELTPATLMPDAAIARNTASGSNSRRPERRERWRRAGGSSVVSSASGCSRLGLPVAVVPMGASGARAVEPDSWTPSSPALAPLSPLDPSSPAAPPLLCSTRSSAARSSPISLLSSGAPSSLLPGPVVTAAAFAIGATSSAPEAASASLAAAAAAASASAFAAAAAIACASLASRAIRSLSARSLTLARSASICARACALRSASACLLRISEDWAPCALWRGRVSGERCRGSEKRACFARRRAERRECQRSASGHKLDTVAHDRSTRPYPSASPTSFSALAQTSTAL